MQPITNADFKSNRELRTARGRREAGCFLVAGKKVVAEAVRSGSVLEVMVTRAFADASPEFLGLIGYAGPVLELSQRQVELLDASATPSGVLARCAMPSVSRGDVEGAELTACFVDVQDPGNLGTMVRTADWFGAGAVMLNAGSVDPYNEKAVAASMGSIFHLPVYVSRNLHDDLRALKDAGSTLIATSPHGSSADLPAGGKRCVVMGGESRGLPDGYHALCDATYTIPGGGKAESLNLSVSFGITMHALTSLHA